MGMELAAICSILPGMKTHITQVFFDATDTLLCVRGSVAALYANIAQRHGVVEPVAKIQAAFSAAISSVPQDVSPTYSADEVLANERDWWLQIAQLTFAPLSRFENFSAFFDDLFESFRQRGAWELLPHTRQTLQTLSEAGIQLGIISDMDSRLFTILEEFEIEQYFSGIHLSFPTGYRKPDERFFAAACRHSNADIAHTVHVGDNWRKDVIGPRQAGLHAVWFQPQDQQAPDLTVPRIADLAQLPELLEQCWPQVGDRETS
jgi:putative hydrolase of the HAD superfamily